MKIITPGNLPIVKFTSKCSTCGAVVEAERHELDAQYDHRDHVEFAVSDCPYCYQYRSITFIIKLKS